MSFDWSNLGKQNTGDSFDWSNLGKAQSQSAENKGLFGRMRDFVTSLKGGTGEAVAGYGSAMRYGSAKFGAEAEKLTDEEKKVQLAAGGRYTPGVPLDKQTAPIEAQHAKLGDTGAKLQAYGKSVSERNYLEPTEFKGIKSYLDPAWLTRNFARGIPSSATLMVPSLAVGAITGGAAGGVLNRGMESAIEAGGVYEEALARGMSKEKAIAAADEAFKRNMKLVGVDILQLTLALKGLQGIGGAITQKIGKPAATIGALAAEAGSEYGEEVKQSQIQTEALGDKWSFTSKETQEAGAIGALMGVGLGGAGEVSRLYSEIHKAAAKKLPDAPRLELNVEVAERMAQGKPREQAAREAMDTLASQSPVINTAVRDATQEVAAKANTVHMPLGKPYAWGVNIEFQNPAHSSLYKFGKDVAEGDIEYDYTQTAKNIGQKLGLPDGVDVMRTAEAYYKRVSSEASMLKDVVAKTNRDARYEAAPLQQSDIVAQNVAPAVTGQAVPQEAQTALPQTQAPPQNVAPSATQGQQGAIEVAGQGIPQEVIRPEASKPQALSVGTTKSVAGAPQNAPQPVSSITTSDVPPVAQPGGVTRPSAKSTLTESEEAIYQSLRPYELQMKADRERLIKQEVDYLTATMGQGVEPGGLIRDADGTVTGRYGRQSRNEKWYSDFYAQHKRKPTKAELREIAIRHLERGSETRSGEAIPANEDFLEIEKALDVLAGLEAKRSGQAASAAQAGATSVSDRFREDINRAVGSSQDVGFVPPALRTQRAPGGSKFAFQDPNIEARYKAAQGIKSPNLAMKIRALGNDIKRLFSRSFEYLPNNTENAPFINELLKLRAAPDVASQNTINDQRGFTLNIQDPELNDLFGRAVFMNDLQYDFETGRDLPQGFTKQNFPVEKARIDAAVAQNPDVAEAIDKRRAWRVALDRQYIQAMKDIGFDVEGRFTDENGNIRVDYMRHQVMEYAALKGMAQGTGKKLRTPTGRGWLKQREGYTGDINTDYLEADYEVAVQQRIDIKKAELIKWLQDPANGYNVEPTVRAEYEQKLEALLTKLGGDPSKVRGRNVSDNMYEGALRNEITAKDPEALNKAKLKDWHQLIPEGYEPWQPQEGNTFHFATTISERLAKQLMENAGKELGISEEAFGKVLAVSGRRAEYVLPEDVVLTLNNMGKESSASPVSKFTSGIMGKWKIWAILNPKRFVGYNIRNASSDTDAAVRGNPSSLTKVKRAAGELWDVFMKDKAPTGDLREFFERGLFSSTMTVQELGDIGRLRVFRNLVGSKGNVTLEFLQDCIDKAKLSTQWREAIMRYANCLDYLEQIQASPTGTPKNFGASVRERIMALSDPYDKALRLSDELIGAYDEVSVATQWLSKHLMPFARYQEIELKREVQLLRNAVQDAGLASTAAKTLLGGVKASPRVALAVGKFALKASMFYGMTMAWNMLFFKDEEDDLPEDVKNRPHIIMGRNPDGSVRAFTRLGMVSDFLEWFGLDQSQYLVKQYLSGKMNIKDVALEMAKAPVRKVWGMFGPQVKIPAETVAGKMTYPDVFDPRAIRDYGKYIADQLALGDVYKWVKGLPQKPTWGVDALRDAITSSYDPEETAYYAILDERGAYLRKQGKEPYYGDPTPKSNALYNAKMAIRYGDIKALDKYLQEYVNLGGTRDGMVASLKGMEPLNGLNAKQRADFTKNWLDDKGRARLEAAEMFYKDSILGTKTTAYWGAQAGRRRPEEKE